MSDILSPEAPSPEPERRRFIPPAEYYDTPPGGLRPLFPRWVPIGCGWISAALLVIAFGGATFLANFGINKIFAWVIDTSHAEMSGMYAKDVAPAKRKEVDGAIDQLTKDLASDRISFAKLQPLLEEMKDAMDDKSITNAEADKLLATAGEVRKPARPSPGASRHPLPGGEGKR